MNSWVGSTAGSVHLAGSVRPRVYVYVSGDVHAGARTGMRVHTRTRVSVWTRERARTLPGERAHTWVGGRMGGRTRWMLECQHAGGAHRCVRTRQWRVLPTVCAHGWVLHGVDGGGGGAAVPLSRGPRRPLRGCALSHAGPRGAGGLAPRRGAPGAGGSRHRGLRGGGHGAGGGGEGVLGLFRFCE